MAAKGLPNPPTFMELAVAGKAQLEDIDDHVSAWHDTPKQRAELHEFLGMKWDEYSAWAGQLKSLESIIAERRQLPQNEDRMTYVDCLVSRTGEIPFQDHGEAIERMREIIRSRATILDDGHVNGRANHRFGFQVASRSDQDISCVCSDLEEELRDCFPGHPVKIRRPSPPHAGASKDETGNG